MEVVVRGAVEDQPAAKKRKMSATKMVGPAVPVVEPAEIINEWDNTEPAARMLTVLNDINTPRSATKKPAVDSDCVSDKLPVASVQVAHTFARPNTTPQFDTRPKDQTGFNSTCPLKIDGFLEMLVDYPNKNFPKLLEDIIKFGTKLGYKGPEKARVLRPNHPTAKFNPEVIKAEIEKEVALGRIKKLAELPDKFYCSPLGLVPKISNGVQTGWRRIFDLSSPAGNQRWPRGGAGAGDTSHEASECRSPGARPRARRIFGLSQRGE